MKAVAITIRAGHVLEHKGKLWVVLKIEITQPGKGAAVIQVEMRDLKSGNKMNERFRTQETVERVRLQQESYQFLYQDGDHFTFMNTQNYEQISLNKDQIGAAHVFLQDGMQVNIETHEGIPLRVDLPENVTLSIVESDPVIKGQTVSSSYKPAILENGVKIMVPPHIGSGIRVVVKTEDGSYVEKAKD